MQSEPAVVPRNVEPALDVVCTVCPPSTSSVIAAPIAPERAHLRLVSSDASSAAQSTEMARTFARQSTIARSSDDGASPPLAEPIDVAVSALWGSPADVLGLLAAASEHRRIVDLIWNAAQIGALQLPPALMTAMERARASWPQALPA